MPNIEQILYILSYSAIPVLLAITVHEVAHGWTAKKFGDRTAEMMGRLTLNPAKHIDPVGTIGLPVLLLILSAPFLFGWAKPVPVAERNLKNPHRDMIWVALAGPVSNILMALIWMIVYRASAGSGFFGSMALIGIQINLILAVLNLLPIPPLDGGRVVKGMMPPKQSGLFDSIEPYGLIIVMLLLFTGVLGPILRPAIDFLASVLFTLTGG
ncbi:MAG: site-2 protease family protein [Pseudomonadota bacterium]